MNKNLRLIATGIFLFLVFLLIKTTMILATLGLILLIMGLINHGIELKNRIYLLLGVIINIIGMFLIYIQYRPDYFTAGIIFTMSVLIIIVTINEYLKISNILNN